MIPHELTQALTPPATFDKPVLETLVSLIDYTRLVDNDSEDLIQVFSQAAKTPLGNVAAICVYPKFLQAVRATQGKSLPLATVVNFPSGDKTLESVCHEIDYALSHDADEIDLVFPYRAYFADQKQQALKMISTAKKLCGNNCLKVILESGELALESLEELTKRVIDAGADFIKTSTGKTSTGATLEAAYLILKTISQHNRNIGFKASGGIKTTEQAWQYFRLSQLLLDEKWASKFHFRVGASSLLDNILKKSS